jgi:hypothetical protein
VAELRLVRPMPVTRYIFDVATEEDVVVTLDDGSRYEVAGDDVPTAALWYGSQKARIMPSRDKIFPVRLHNTSTDERVKARRINATEI